MTLTSLLFSLLILFSTAPNPDKTVYLVRHAETCTEPDRDPELTNPGQKRATDLVRVLSDIDLSVIYSTPLKRTLATAGPIATEKGITITTTDLASGFLERLADEIRGSDAVNILVSGHSNTTPTMVNLLTGSNLENLDDGEFDRLYIVTIREDGSADYQILRYGDESAGKEVC
ncbi:MAG: histidine phosphatase family protein [Bacteroidetes Order II. Incertae sedis bacterium]|jgi:broad specificity phosphatase PhoE|nr:histidine phosphatase family protein [Bacteroidetes Order II. bacterium]MBT4603191.1 histidine phosphatase family protein [Bacteroidetes Order II. bacterium]MBT5249539.1 histidine phosphatase family protein [Bacteroidetes Order II. bacterium]MBT6201580.1 histidine phosphatase family protein [Bacteroidetes Order II. bacterium]MBT7401404.1 histidine phosphatase family protein [Bacteroidetes Order II. bacterium]